MPFYSRAVAGLVLFALAAACNSPTAPSRPPIEPSQSRTEPSRTWPDLTGTYTLTLSASSRCPLELPEAMPTRTYPATVAQVDGSLTVTVHSPFNFPGIWNDIGRSTGAFGENDDVIFQPFGLEEWFPEEPFTLFEAFGSMTTTISADGLSGVLDGVMRGILPNEDGHGTRVVTCTAPDHGAVFSR